MHQPLPPNPVAEALRIVLRGNSSLFILDYSDKKVFKNLWLEGLESPTPKISGRQVNEKAVLLIVGEDPPDEVCRPENQCLEGINVRGHLTAASWAAAWRLKFPKAKARVVVLSASPYGSGSPIVKALCALFEARAANNSPLVPGVSLLKSPSLETLCDVLEDCKNSGAELAPAVQAMLRAALWDGLTSDREKHHAVSNVLGALLLSAEVGAGAPYPEKALAQHCLLALARACGVDAKINNKGGAWITADLRTGIGAALLIDDMADIWGDFLRGALGFSVKDPLPGKRRTCFESFTTTPSGLFYEELLGSKESKVAGLPERLKSFLMSNEQFLSADDLISGSHKIQSDFVLFLDLRLFQAGGVEGNRQSEFFKELAGFGLALIDGEHKRKCPWLDKRGRALLRKELHHIAEGSPLRPASASTAPPVETLLPRLLALLDPTLPIIIFSSTHHAGLVDQFRDYGNIITAFRKPVVSGMTRDWSEIVNELRVNLNSALEQAARILRLRRALQTFQRGASQVSGGVGIQLPASKNGYLVEIFFDESAKEHEPNHPKAICAGGLVVIRTLDENVADSAPIVSDAAIFRCLHSVRGLWGWCDDIPNGFSRPTNTPLVRGFMPKGLDLNFNGTGKGPQLLEAMLKGIRSALGRDGCVFPFAAISEYDQSSPKWMAGLGRVPSWEVEKIFDTTLHRLVQHVLEGLLFRSDVLKEALNHPNSRVAIDLGMRDYKCAPNSLLTNNFGIKFDRNKHGSKRYSFHDEDGYQIVSETIARTGIKWPSKSRIVRARVVALKDFGGTESKPTQFLPKQLHYFADAIAHVALHDLDGARAGSAVVEAFFVSGWISDARPDKDRDEPDRLEIGRAWSQGDRVPAIRRAAKLASDAPVNGIGINLFRELSRGASLLEGPELLQLISDL